MTNVNQINDIKKMEVENTAEENIKLQKNINLAKDKVLKIFTERFGETSERDEILIMVGELVSKKILLKIIENLKGLSRANFVTYVNLGKVGEATAIAIKNNIDIDAIAKEVSEEVLKNILAEDLSKRESEENIKIKSSEDDIDIIVKKVMSLTGLIPEEEETVNEFLKRATKRKEELDQKEKELENKKIEDAKNGKKLNEKDEAKLKEIKKLKEELAKLG